jgi:hypothetical protein
MVAPPPDDAWPMVAAVSSFGFRLMVGAAGVTQPDSPVTRIIGTTNGVRIENFMG